MTTCFESPVTAMTHKGHDEEGHPEKITTTPNNNNNNNMDDDTTRAQEFYDQDDAQQFYRRIWGTETVHIGRYDLLTDCERTTLNAQAQIVRAQEHHETEFLRLIQTKVVRSAEHTKQDPPPKLVCVDFGCGYGGFLRRLWKANMLVSSSSSSSSTTTAPSVGIDISHKMCQQARELNEQVGCDKDIAIHQESFLQPSVPDNSVDLIVSMEALLHVGPQGQRQAIQQAYRILKPGGWMIFTDILQNEGVNPHEMQPIYDRICLSAMGTVQNYQRLFAQTGFAHFAFESHASNIAAHYGAVLRVLQQQGDAIGLRTDFQQSMQAGLQAWVDLAPQNMEWGFLMAQKKMMD